MNNDEPDFAQEVRRLSMLVEEVISQNKAVLEIVADNQRQLSKLTTMESDIKDLKDDVATIKFAVTETNKEQKLHDRRITKLEKTASS